MEKRSVERAMIDTVVSELYEIKCHLCNHREFEAGVGLGSLISSLMIRGDSLDEESEKLAAECENCGEDKRECGCVQVGLAEKYDSKAEEVKELQQDVRDALYENSKLRNQLNSLKSLIKKLFNADQVHPNQREEVRQELLKCEETQNQFDGQFSNKNSEV